MPSPRWQFTRGQQVGCSQNCFPRVLLCSISPISLSDLFLLLRNLNSWWNEYEENIFCLFSFILFVCFYSGSTIKSLSKSLCFHKENPSFGLVILPFILIQEGGPGKVSWYHQGTSQTQQQVPMVGTWWQQKGHEWNGDAKSNYSGKSSRKHSSRTLYLPNRLRCWFCWLQSMTILAKLFSVKPSSRQKESYSLDAIGGMILYTVGWKDVLFPTTRNPAHPESLLLRRNAARSWEWAIAWWWGG